jgi:hypothetical protein
MVKLGAGEAATFYIGLDRPVDRLLPGEQNSLLLAFLPSDGRAVTGEVEVVLHKRTSAGEQFAWSATGLPKATGRDLLNRGASPDWMVMSILIDGCPWGPGSYVLRVSQDGLHLASADLAA